MTITPDELEALVAHITDLEAQIADKDAQIAFLLKERILLKEGAAALVASSSTLDPDRKIPPGHAVGNAGQLYVANPKLAGVIPTGSRRWRPD